MFVHCVRLETLCRACTYLANYNTEFTVLVLTYVQPMYTSHEGFAIQFSTANHANLTL